MNLLRTNEFTGEAMAAAFQKQRLSGLQAALVMAVSRRWQPCFLEERDIETPSASLSRGRELLPVPWNDGGIHDHCVCRPLSICHCCIRGSPLRTGVQKCPYTSDSPGQGKPLPDTLHARSFSLLTSSVGRPPYTLSGLPPPIIDLCRRNWHHNRSQP